MPRKQYWKIIVYDGAEKTFEKLLPVGSLSKSGIISLLQRLAAMHLNEDEIISTSLRRNAPGYWSLLEPQYSRGKHPTITIYAGREYEASIVEAGELPEHKE
ncbi:MAG: hypothetical protein IIA72_24060 [Proteobacteria bacterium]|nr:hypothetical protein [Pseudomonadota bacterium]